MIPIMKVLVINIQNPQVVVNYEDDDHADTNPMVDHIYTQIVIIINSYINNQPRGPTYSSAHASSKIINIITITNNIDIRDGCMG